LNFACRPAKVGLVTAAKVIEEMDDLPPEEQAKVIQHAFELARHRQLSPGELGDLAERLGASSDWERGTRGHRFRPLLAQRSRCAGSESPLGQQAENPPRFALPAEGRDDRAGVKNDERLHAV
jgi:hypothetical protein